MGMKNRLIIETEQWCEIKSQAGKGDVEVEDDNGEDRDYNAKEEKEQGDANNIWIKGLRKFSKHIHKKYRFPGLNLNSWPTKYEV